MPRKSQPKEVVEPTFSPPPIQLSELPANITTRRGIAELTLIGEPASADATEEVTESQVPQFYDVFEDGGIDRLRLLDDFALYTPEGKFAPLEALDAEHKERRLVGFGTVVEPLPSDAAQRLHQLEARLGKSHFPYVARKSRAAGLPLAAESSGTSSTCPAASDHSVALPNVLRLYRDVGSLIYYNDKYPKCSPMEVESGEDRPLDETDGDESFNRRALSTESRVDCFCLNTHKWYGARVIGLSGDGS